MKKGTIVTIHNCDEYYRGGQTGRVLPVDIIRAIEEIADVVITSNTNEDHVLVLTLKDRA